MASATNRQVISDIVNDMRALNLDDRVSKKFILSKLRNAAAQLIKREADSRRILAISDLWTEVQCVELCRAPLIDCCNTDIPNCKFVMKSKNPIPATYETLYKELLQIFNPFFAKEFKQITPQEYKDLLTREFQDKRIKYFWLSNGYLVIPDCLVESVVLRGVFVEPAKAKQLNSCESTTDKCVSILDQPFVCPEYLMKPVKDITLENIFNFYKRNVLDEEPNLNTNLKVGFNK